MTKVFQVRGPFNIQDLDSAPDLPGLYVWYARFRVGEADWDEVYAGGNERAAFHLMKALREHSLKFGRQELDVRVQSNFSCLWKGALREEQSAKWKTEEANEEEDGFSERVGPALADNRRREFLVEFLESSFPYFSSPLYLGKASDQTLRERLRQHSNHFLELWEKYIQDQEFALRIQNPKDFAERAFKLGFAPEDLFCMTITVDPAIARDLKRSEISLLIESAEWLLNRWATPILGRR